MTGGWISDSLGNETFASLATAVFTRAKVFDDPPSLGANAGELVRPH